MSRKIVLALILIMAILTLGLIGYVPKTFGQSGTNVSSQIITSNTTWTQAGSPFTLTGPVGISEGATLIIEPGVTVNFGTNFLQVNGTIAAEGSASEPIIFNGYWNPEFDYINAHIDFSQSSTGWDDKTGTGSIIQDCNISDISININDASPKIADNQIYSAATPPGNGGGIDVNGGSPLISANNILVNYAISVSYGDPTIVYNTIYGCSGIGVSGGSSLICYNNVTGNSEFNGISFYDNSNSYVSDNTISNYGDGIEIQGNSGTVTIQRNLITGCYDGIETYKAGVIIQNNTFVNAKNPVAFPTSLYLHASPVVIYNNFQSNTGSIWVTSPGNVNATYNWWGTTDIQAINQTIYDSKNDFTVGTVDFIPFLTSPNPEAMPNLNAPIPISSSSSTVAPSAQSSSSPTSSSNTLTSPSPTPSISPNNQSGQINAKSSVDWTQIALFVAIAIIAALIIVVVVLVRKGKASIKT